MDRSALIDKLIEINEFADFTDIVPVSALEHDNLAEVRNVLVENMPEGPQMYPAEQITERPEDTIAELIRGAFLEELMTSCRIRSPWWWIPSNIRKTTTAANPTRARRR